MKVKTLSALAGVGAAMILSSGAQAAPVLTLVSSTTTATFLQANGLQSAVIGITGFGPGENLQGLIGTSANPWTITCSSGTFFNVGSDGPPTSPTFDGAGQIAATAATAPGQPGNIFDSGILQNSTTTALGGVSGNPGTNAIGFAQFGVGANSGPMSPVSWLTLNSAGIPVVSANLFRLTWSASASATIAMRIVTNTGGGNGFEYAASLTIPAVPAPGALALLGVAGLVGGARRRRA